VQNPYVVAVKRTDPQIADHLMRLWDICYCHWAPRS